MTSSISIINRSTIETKLKNNLETISKQLKFDIEKK